MVKVGMYSGSVKHRVRQTVEQQVVTKAFGLW